MPKRSPRLLLEDIVAPIAKVERYVEDLDRTAFLADDRTIDAVIRNLEIIGEASRQMPDDFKIAHADIPWAKMSGLRNRIVHDYIGIDLEMVWHIVRHEIGGLEADIRRLL